jgi:hypothetical protein
MIYIGIDPGLDGAIAYVPERGTAWVEDVPTLKAGDKGRRVYAIPEMRLLLQVEGVGFCVIEAVTPAASPGRLGAFSLGLSTGIWTTLLVVEQVPYDPVAASVWKLAMGLRGKGKDASIAAARQLFPHLTNDLSRKGDHNRAEALLIAEYARRQHAPTAP